MNDTTTHDPQPPHEAQPEGEGRPATRRTTRTTTLVAIGAVVAAVAVGVTLASTLGDGDDNANGSVPVGGVGDLDGSWKAVNWVGAPQEVVGDVRLRFEDGRVVVETGCNAGRGTVEVVDSRLVAGPMVSTKMGCEAPLMEQEAWLFAMVSSTPRLELSGPYLSLHWDTPDATAPEGAAPSQGAGERWWVTFENEEPPSP